MSQPDLSLTNRPIAARPAGPSDRGTPYTVLLILALVAVLVGSLFMLLEQRAWYLDLGQTWPSGWLYAYIAAAVFGFGAIIAVAVTSRWN